MPIFEIYTLANPENGLIEYVGCTSQFKVRREQHYCRVKREGLPARIMQVIDRTGDEAEAKDLETYWIHQLRSWGFALSNSYRNAPYKLVKKTNNPALTDLALSKITPDIIRKIAQALDRKEQSIKKYIEANDNKLTKYAAYLVIMKETGLNSSQILKNA